MELITDASSFALGSVLATRIDGTLRPIAYYSRKLSDAERNYNATDRKLLSVVDSLRHFRHCLLGREFKVKTDHKPLLWYFSLNTQLSHRQAHWQATLCEF